MVLEFDEETRSFPCKKCGHLIHSAEALENYENTSHGNDKCFYCRNYNKGFHKNHHEPLHEVHCLGQYYLEVVVLYLKWIELKQWCLITKIFPQHLLVYFLEN